MNIGEYIRDHNATVTASANMDRYGEIEVTITTETSDGNTTHTGKGVGDSWDFDTAFANAIKAVNFRSSS